MIPHNLRTRELAIPRSGANLPLLSENHNWVPHPIRVFVFAATVELAMPTGHSGSSLAIYIGLN